MKLRLQFNSVRLRLKRSEVEQFARTGWIEERIVWTSGISNTLSYALEATDEISSPKCTGTPIGILIQVPKALALTWASSDDIGIEGYQSIEASEPLRILIEKDMACIDGNEEENVDTFPNPLAEK